jgi:membrane protein involved in colicin uptake
LKELKTPWLKKQTRFHVDELARARRVTTEQLLNRIIQDFLDAHTDEIGDAQAAAKKRESEHDAQVAAAEAARKVERENADKYRAEQKDKAEQETRERAERDALAKAEIERDKELRRKRAFLMNALVDEWIPQLHASDRFRQVSTYEVTL